MWRSAFRLRPGAALAGASVAGGALAAGHVVSVNVLPVAHAADELKTVKNAGITASMGIMGVGVAGLVGAGIFVGTFFYKTVPPSSLMCVYGAGRSMTIYKGGGSIVLPGIQQAKLLSLEPMPLEIRLGSALSLERIRVNIPAVFTVAVGSDEEYHAKAAERLLSMQQEEIKHQAKEIITGQLRAVVAQMDIDQINTDRRKFNEMIEEMVSTELKKIGLELVNVNITDVNDASGKIEAQGKKAAAESIEKARIDEATERKKGEVGTAEQEMEKRIAVAESLMKMKIGVAEAEKQQRIREAEINYDTVSAENKNQELVAATERDLKITLAETYGASESKDREAKAFVEEAEAKAFAAAAMEKANRVEAEKRAEFEAPAKAMKATTILQAQAEAEKIIIEARGKADATFIQMEAEAKGHFELLDKKAQGLGALVSSCGGADEAFKLLMLEHVDTLAETSAKAISNIKFDKVTVWDGGAGATGNSATSDFIRSLTQSLPPSMEVIEKVAGVKLPELDSKKIDA